MYAGEVTAAKKLYDDRVCTSCESLNYETPIWEFGVYVLHVNHIVVLARDNVARADDGVRDVVSKEVRPLMPVARILGHQEVSNENFHRGTHDRRALFVTAKGQTSRCVIAWYV